MGLHTEFFIAKGLILNKEGEKQISSPAIRIAIVSLILGLIIMILAVSIVIGFKTEVANKVIGFGSHIQIGSVHNRNTYESFPLAFTDAFIDSIAQAPNVKHVDRFATVPAIIKTDTDFHVIILKGVDENYEWEFFEKSLVSGSVPAFVPDSVSTQVLISKNIADKMLLSQGDSFITYFIQDPVRARRFTIAGVYQTNFLDYDKLFVLSDIKQIRRLNAWDEDMSNGLEIQVEDYGQLEKTSNDLFYNLAGKRDRLDNPFYVRSIRELNPAIFEWLDVLDMNAIVILILMLIVAGFSMISGLLIIITERANTIGVLKSLGQNNMSIRRVFLLISIYLIAKALLWGNAIALLIVFVQKKLGILRLDPEIYYLSEVPIHLDFGIILLINLGTLIVTTLILVGPSYLISKISPAKTIRFE